MNPKATLISRKQRRIVYIIIAAVIVVLFVVRLPINNKLENAEFKDRNNLGVTILNSNGHIPGRKVEKIKEDEVPNIKKYTNDIAKKIAIEKAKKEAILMDQDKNKPSKLKNNEIIGSLSEYSAKADYKSMIGSSPVVIFSKSYCPYSKKLKALLSTKYKITPEPFILELDLYEHGADLQKHIGKVTKRATVPNLIINGFSYGGCDDIVALDNEGDLLASLTKWLGDKAKVSMVNKV